MGTNPTAEEPYLDGCTELQAMQLLALDVASAEHAITWCVKPPLNQNQFDCLVDFTFNLGTGSLLHSTLLQVLNADNYSAVPAELARWTYAGGKQSPDLIRRRQAEADLWNASVAS